uniref:rhomboid protease n=1 Tax=Labrus bergylta TaxID=56723 RepID=A0A3Q3E5B9_9LABR
IGTREAPVNSSPAVAANAEGEEIEVLESTDVLPVAPEDYDPDSSGFISTERFRDLLATHGSELDPHKLEVLLALADGNADGKICYQDFVNLVSCCKLMSNKRSNSFRRAILQGSRQLKGCSLRDEVGLGLPQRLVRHVAYETLPREVDRKWYFDSYTYCPPPWLILVITIAEVAVFMYYGFQLDRLVLQVSSPSFLKIHITLSVSNYKGKAMLHFLGTQLGVSSLSASTFWILGIPSGILITSFYWTMFSVKTLGLSLIL